MVAFSKDDISAITKKAKYNYCSKYYICSVSGTSSLWRHLQITLAGLLEASETQNLLNQEKFTQETFRKYLLEQIILNSQSFIEVEKSAFQKLVMLLNLYAQLPSGDTIKQDILNRYKSEKINIKQILTGTSSQLSFILDAWTSPNMIAFLGITVHQINDNWISQHIPLDISQIDGPHSGENLCSIFENICTELRIIDKIFTINADNASNNITFINHF